ncbi:MULTISPECIES: hypothetical protein [Leuconostoc]|uniref:hypothetical protein n=1 Tax=Leuconostoc TaxID=1243 RepID=UPI0032DE8D60
MKTTKQIKVSLGIYRMLRIEVLKRKDGLMTPLTEAAFTVFLIDKGQKLASLQQRALKKDYRKFYADHETQYKEKIGSESQRTVCQLSYSSPVTWLANLTVDETNFYLYLGLFYSEETTK